MQAASPEDFYGEGVRSLTLGEALRRHYLINPQFTVWNQHHGDIAKKLVKAHDISHLIFGCDTGLPVGLPGDVFVFSSGTFQ